MLLGSGFEGQSKIISITITQSYLPRESNAIRGEKEWGDTPEPPIATKKAIEQMFDGAALTYDRIGPSIFTKFGARLVERMPFAPGSRVLDIATGKGAVLLPAARCVGPEGHVTGIDISSGILKEAEQVAHKEGLSNVDFKKMDAEHLEFPDQSFDAVTCAFALFLFPDMEAALREMYRVCKPDGYVGVTLFDMTPPTDESRLADFDAANYGISCWNADATTTGLCTPGSESFAQ